MNIKPNQSAHEAEFPRVLKPAWRQKKYENDTWRISQSTV